MWDQTSHLTCGKPYGSTQQTVGDGGPRKVNFSVISVMQERGQCRWTQTDW